LALPGPGVDVEPYKKELRRANEELYKMTELKEYFSEMAGKQVQKTIALKNVPKQIKQQLGQFLDFPKAYEMLEALANSLEENNRRVA